MDLKKIWKDNAGFSLIELIVTILVTSILMLGVLAFMNSSRSAYQTVSTSATLQEESLTAERVLSEFFMEAKLGYKYDVDGKTLLETYKAYGFDDNVSVSTDTEGGTTNTDVIWVRARENDGLSDEKDIIYFFVLDKYDNTLRYCRTESYDDAIKVVNEGTEKTVVPETGKKFIYDDGSVTNYGKEFISSNCYKGNEKYTVIAEHMISIGNKTRVHKKDGDMVVIELKYDYLGKEYTSTLTATTRNKSSVTSTSGGGI